jgi:RNA polymerase sigma factor (sigma-70 family)
VDEEDERYDVELLIQVRGGDIAAFAELYRRYASIVLRYAWGTLRERGAAEDVTQDTFVVVWAKRMSARIVADSLLPWILAIAKNASSNELRKQRRRGYSSEEELQNHPGRLSPFEDLAWMQLAVEKLSLIDRELCRLCLVEGLTFREAAHLLESTEGAVSKRVQRARLRLRVSLGIEE